jgi:hypothetical protein
MLPWSQRQQNRPQERRLRQVKTMFRFLIYYLLRYRFRVRFLRQIQPPKRERNMGQNLLLRLPLHQHKRRAQRLMPGDDGLEGALQGGEI